MGVVEIRSPDGTIISSGDMAEVPAAGDIIVHRRGPFMVLGRVWGGVYPKVVVRSLTGAEDLSFTHITSPPHVHCGVSGHTDPGEG